MAKRIYVADDELHIRTLIQTFLVNEGYEVETLRMERACLRHSIHPVRT